MDNTIKEALQQESAYRKKLEEIKGKLYNASRDAAPLPGVTPIGAAESKGLKCASVSFAALKANSGNLSAKFYIQPSQADLVATSLDSARTVSELVSRIEKMVETKCVVAKGTTYQLNPRTIDILQKFL